MKQTAAGKRRGKRERAARDDNKKAGLHLEPRKRSDLNQVFCLEEERKVSNDWVVTIRETVPRIEPRQKAVAAAGSRVAVRHIAMAP